MRRRRHTIQESPQRQQRLRVDVAPSRKLVNTNPKRERGCLARASDYYEVFSCQCNALLACRACMPPRRRNAGRPRRGGAAMIVVLLGLVLATAVFLSVLKLIALQRESVDLQTRQIQADWLAQSAVERGRARLSAEPGYRGETWNISARDIGGRDAATAVIRVDDVAGKPDRRAIHVEAVYSHDPSQRVQQTRDVVVQLNKEPKP